MASVDSNQLTKQPTANSIKCYVHTCDRSTIQISRDDELTKCRLCSSAESHPKKLIELAYPFFKASAVKCDIVVIPSRGSFVQDNYKATSGLHVGITQSDGKLLEFVKEGLKYSTEDEPKWQHCVPMRFLDRISNNADKRLYIEGVWHEVVESYAERGVECYHPTGYNCLDFVLMFLSEFLTHLELEGEIKQQVDTISSKVHDKEAFCESFVVDRTREVARYIALSRKLRLGIESISNKDFAA